MTYTEEHRDPALLPSAVSQLATSGKTAAASHNQNTSKVKIQDVSITTERLMLSLGDGTCFPPRPHPPPPQSSGNHESVLHV